MEGYGIIFRHEHLFSVEKDIRDSYAMTAIDEAGNFHSIYELVSEQKAKNITILTRDLFTPLIYAEAVKRAMGSDVSIIGIMDKTSFPDMDKEQMTKLMSPEIEALYLVDETKPIKAYEEICGQSDHNRDRDLVIVGEDIRGAETLAVLIARDKGSIFFSSIKSNYAQGVFVAETMGKSVATYYFDQYVEGNQEFTMSLVKAIVHKLDMVDGIYRKKKGSARFC